MIRVIRNRIDGIGEPLPSGEAVLWSASPAPLPFAARVLKLKWVGLWFLALGVWRGIEAAQAGAGVEGAVLKALGQLPLACAALTLLCALGYAMARSTTYAVTQRRVVLQVGIALPITVNLPLRFIDGAAVQPVSGGTGDLHLTLAPGSKTHSAALWPNVRTASDGRVQPVMRNVPEAALLALAPVLAEVLQRSQQEQENAARATEAETRNMMMLAQRSPVDLVQGVAA